MTPEQYEKALARIPTWMAVIAVIGVGIEFRHGGLSAAAGFVLGAVGAWVNLRLIIAAVDRIIRSEAKPGAGTGMKVFAQFGILVLLALVIMRLTGFNLMALLVGFLVCPAAVLVEIVYELFTT